MEVVVTGIGIICPLGWDTKTIWHRLLAGESAIVRHQPFPLIPPHPLALLGNHPADPLALCQRTVATALVDAALAPPLPDCGVVLGSSRSQQTRWEALCQDLGGDRSHLPIWLDTLPHMLAIHTARQIGSTAAVQAPMAACATGLWAIAQATALIRRGYCQRVVAGAVEAPITPLTLVGFDRLKALAKTGCYPFDRQREGLVLGEGGAVLVLESASLARDRGARIYGSILGFGCTADAHRTTAPQIEGKPARTAVLQCLQRSGLSASDIDYIHAHGTSTLLNDRSEAALIQQLFPPGVPVSSTKGATGHTLGASGALGTAFSLLAIAHQTLPPCTGLKDPAFNLNLVRTVRSTQVRRVLCFSFGFGGQNAVLALGQHSRMNC